MKEDFIKKLYNNIIKKLKNARIGYSDTKIVKILKLCYLMPICIILYPFLVIVLGVIEMGNPFSTLKDIFNE